ncbi:MAG: hypothetical protein H7330_10940 [Hymenobacteraceae bacterium]|nr:hypothetical protein [Hymenobacteraceae bacterium]
MLYFSASLFRRLLAVAALLLTAATAEAKIWRIDNNGGSPGDFITAQAAHDAATVVVNDTLYFNGSGTSYGDLTMTKRLYVFGPGYHLSQNPETQAVTNTAYIHELRVMPSAAGSAITGMQLARVRLFASNTLFKRNYVGSDQHAVVIGDQGAFVGTYTPSNVIFTQNYVTCGGGNRALWVFSGCSNVIVTNNLLYSSNPGWYGVYADASLIFSNNVVYGILRTPSTNITNTYLYGGSLEGAGNSYNNNICNGTQFPAINGNVQNQPIANVCVASGSDDGYFQLKPNTVSPAYTNPAIGTGVGGVDMGMFGGTDPYVLSGMPAIPAIWFFSAPSSGSGAGGLQIQLKAKSHN